MPRKSTRGAQGAGTIRQRPDGRWEARYTAGRDPGTGRQVQKSIYGKTQKEVRQKLQQIAVAIDAGVYTEPSKLTFGAWLDIWLEEYTAHLKEKTLIVYKGHVKNNIKPALGAVKLTALTGQIIQKFYNDLQKGKSPLAPKSIKNIHGVIHKALQQSMELGYIRTNPSTACKLPRVEKPHIQPLDSGDIGRFLAAINGHENERVFLLDIFTGLRQSELIGLTWDCIDFEKGTIFVYRQLQLLNGEYKFTSLKNNKTRLISPAPFVMDALRAQKRVQNEWRLMFGAGWKNDGFVFTNPLGEHLKSHTIYKQCKRIMAEIGMPEARFHDMRHTYAVTALQAGDDVKTVQENLGHHTAAFTLDVYGHVTEQMKKASAQRMEEFIQGIKTNSPQK